MLAYGVVHFGDSEPQDYVERMNLVPISLKHLSLRFCQCIQFVSLYGPFKNLRLQGPVVQSIVSLTSSLRGQLVKSFTFTTL